MVGADSAALGVTSLAERLAVDGGPLRVAGLRGGSRAALVGELAARAPQRSLLLLVPNSKAADAWVGDLRAALGSDGQRVRELPRHDVAPYDRFSPQPFVVAERMDVLHRWLAGAADPCGAAPIVVAPWTALVARVPSRDAVSARTVTLAVGQTIDRDGLVAALLETGYARQSLVEEPGELAVRGGVLDLFPPQRDRPVRVELLGDEIESIREFDPASQRSQGGLSQAVAPPARELLFDREWVAHCGDALRELAKTQGVPGRDVDRLVDGLLRGHAPPGAEALASILQPGLETVLDFLPDDALVVVDDPSAGHERLEQYAAEALDNHAVARETGRLVASPAELYLAPDQLEAQVARRGPVSLLHLELDAPSGPGADRVELASLDHDDLRRELARSRRGDAALAPLVRRLESWCADGWRCCLTAPTLSAAERTHALLADYGVEAEVAADTQPLAAWSAPGAVEIRVAAFSSGFALPLEQLSVVTDEEIFGAREKRHVRASWQEGIALEALAQLRAGDFVVHEGHGIGIYRGLVEMRFGASEGEFLRIEYEGGDRLFVPVHRLNLVQRYAGADGFTPRVDKLGGASWERARRGVRRSLRDMAKELLRVHAERELAPGFAYQGRDRHFEEFEATFPYEETPDQAAAIEDVLQDLQKPRPMDRLVCGDVGYGKTEVAVRAAFRAVLDGKQVAVLVPTTVLCQQHLETFRERFEGHPIAVESLSRFRNTREAREVREGLASGRVDVVVGTHRLLQKNVEFRDLGLLVVDEEHRFGVAHKERIKQLKQTVDVLTLTATPIPRTLQMAFTGIRDLSIINTPPADRLAIRTQVCRTSDSLVREAVLREVRRGGQVFFVHNRVRSIGAQLQMLERVVPEVKVLTAHGQMRERELEDRMLAFMHGEADVLLCTTIIESGLDIPRANTILIHRADALGLAQLYQLRGRVGRSRHRAYAYLLVPGEGALSADARRRLEAIQGLTELGSGFRLANMDLEIRGAGNLLGAEQSGNLAAVGYETYMEMLEEAVDELRGAPRTPGVDPEIRLPVAARLPDDYVPDVGQRLVLYKRLAGSRGEEDVGRIRDELLDRYGALPDAAGHLLDVIRLKIEARRFGVAAVDLARGRIVLSAGGSTRVDPERLMALMADGSGEVRVTPDHKVVAPGPDGPGAEAIFRAAHAALARLGEPLADA